MNKHIKKWYTQEFKEEVERLSERFLSSCLLWGLIFGEINEADDEKDIEAAIQFTKREFPKRHPELKERFEKIFGTLIYVTTSYDRKSNLVVHPQINTIYTYYTWNQKVKKHDLITPMITALAKDCLVQAHFWKNQLMS